MDVEVAEHGVGFPTAKQLDGVLIHVGAEESSGSPRAEAARADEVWGNASRFVQGGGRMSKGVGDVLRFDGPLLTVVRVVCTDGCAVGDVPTADVHDESRESFARAQDWIVRGPVADLFATHSVLLVSEREGGIRDVSQVRFIQSCRGGLCRDAKDREMDVFQSECLGA